MWTTDDGRQRTDDGPLVYYKLTLWAFGSGELISDQIRPCRKIGQGQPRVIIWTNLVVLMHLTQHTKFQGHRNFGSRKEDFLTWRPSWSCDLDHLNKLSFPHPREAPHEIWLQSAQWFQRRCLKMLTHTDAEAYLSYKLTTEPNILRLRWANKPIPFFMFLSFRNWYYYFFHSIFWLPNDLVMRSISMNNLST